MATNTPSYLTSRGNIYYFQMRVPSYIQNKNIPRNRIIRRSTKTGNLREALTISRQWWLSIMNNNFFEETYPALAEFEKADFENDREIEIGLSIITELKRLGIDEDNRLSFDSYFEGNPPHYLKCYIKGKEYKKRLKKIKKDKKLEKQKNKPETIPQAPQSIAQTSLQAINTVEPSDLMLSDVLKRWVKVNERKDSGKQWASDTVKSYIPAIKVMIEMVGNPLAHQLTKVMLRDKFVNKIENLPKDIATNKIYQDTEGDRLPLVECFELAEENNLKRIENSTIEKYATRATIFLNWASKEDYISYGLNSVLDSIKNISDDDPRRKAFNEDELKALFETDEYREGLLFKKPQWHWSLLIMLYTGCRLGEACQFYIDDIFETDEKYSDGSKVWVFNFTNKGKGQKVKSQKANFSSLVPVHPDLIKLGFLNYYQQRKEKGEKQLFNVSPKEWGRSSSRWFNGEKNKIGYAERQGVFTDEDRPEFYTDKNRRIDTRSFRHYISNRSKQELDWHYQVWCEITHHSDGEKSTVRKERYEDAYEIATKVKEIEKLTFDFVDIDGIKKWH